MRKNLGAKPYVYPQVVLIVAAYDEAGTPNAMNAAYGGVAGSNKIFLCLSANHKTVKNIQAKGAFTVSVGDEAHMAECDYVGVASGNNVPNKLEKCGFHTEKSEFVDAPVIQELPLALECKLISYDPDTHYMFGEIVNVSVDEKAVTPEGALDMAKLAPITYDNANKAYLALGQKVGDAFSDGKKFQ